jgi:hypothetical protein
MKKLLLLFSIGISSCGFAQTVTDGLMMPKKTLCTGFIYSHDQWTNYWEGELKRENGNIGKVTTTSVMWVGNYGLTDKINIITMVPYIKTKASQGTLSGMEGVQDLSLSVKYNFFKKEIGTGKLKTFGVLSYSTPLTDYSPDFYPLSLGTQTQNISWRATANYALDMGLYFNASGAYTWRSNTKLDRPSYYTNGQMYISDEVKMPDVFDFVVNVGYHKGPLQGDVYYMQMNTLGGGDIRRQDMPFVSNRMNAIKFGAFVMYYVSVPKGLALRAGGSFTAAGRNVGQSSTLMAGLLYTIQFSKPQI